MRILVSKLLLVLTFCLGAAPAAVAQSGAAAARAPAAGRAAFPLARATPDEVRARLGVPAVASEEGKGALWTYRLEGCALMVFFKDEGAGLRVSGVTSGPRRRADQAPDAESCIAGVRR
jgi:hypothetical protein